MDRSRCQASDKFWTVVGTIIVADISLAFDNLMGVEGVAEGHIRFPITTTSLFPWQEALTIIFK